jgi:hypothetical protein
MAVFNFTLADLGSLSSIEAAQEIDYSLFEAHQNSVSEPASSNSPRCPVFENAPTATPPSSVIIRSRSRRGSRVSHCSICSSPDHQARSCPDAVEVEMVPASNLSVSGPESSQQTGIDIATLFREIQRLKNDMATIRERLDRVVSYVEKEQVDVASKAIREFLTYSPSFVQMYPYLPPQDGDFHDTAITRLLQRIHAAPDDLRGKLTVLTYPDNQSVLQRLVSRRLADLRNEMFSSFHACLEEQAAEPSFCLQFQEEDILALIEAVGTLPSFISRKRLQPESESSQPFHCFLRALALAYLTLIRYILAEKEDSFQLSKSTKEIFGFILLRLALEQAATLSPKLFSSFQTWTFVLSRLPALWQCYERRHPDCRAHRTLRTLCL